jgi:WD40 repeat protein
MRIAAVLAVVLFPLAAAADPPDPLPPGSVARLGSTRYHHHGRQFLGLGDHGKALLFLGPRSVHWADLSTGLANRAALAPHFFDEAQPVPAVLAAKAPVLAVIAGLRLGVYNAETGAEIYAFLARDLFQLPPEVRTIYPTFPSFALSPDGQRLVVLDPLTATSIVVLDVKTKQPRLTLRSRENHAFSSLAVSDDGRTVAAVEYGRDEKLRQLVRWDLVTGKLLGATDLPAEPIARFELLPGGKALLAVRHDGQSVALIDLANTKVVHSFAGNDLTEPFRFTASADGKSLYIAGQGVIQEWDLATGKPARVFSSPVLAGPGPVQVARTPDGRHLIGVGRWAWAAWDLTTGQPLYTPAGHVGPVGAVAFSPDSKRLLSAGSDGVPCLWDVAAAKLLHRLTTASAATRTEEDARVAELTLRQAAFSADGKMAASTGPGQYLHLWDAATGKHLEELGEGFFAPPFAFAPKGQTLAFLDGDTVRLREPEAEKDLRTWKWRAQADGEPVPNGGMTALAMSPDGQLLAVVGHRPKTADLCIDLWEPATGKKRATLDVDAAGLTGWKSVDRRDPFNAVGGLFGPPTASTLPIIALAFAPDGKHLAAATLVTIHLFDLASGKEVHTFGGRQVFGGSLAFSPDGKLLAAGCYDGSIRFWNLATGTLLRDVPGHELAVSRLAFSHDGKRLASASLDSTVLVWDVVALLKAPADKQATPTAQQLEQWWSDLGDADAAKAFRAMNALAAVPGEATSLLKTRLHPVPPAPPRRLGLLVQALGSPKFTERDKAAAELEKLAELARSALEERLAAKPTLEVRKRIEALLAKLDGPVTRPEALRALRAVEVLERLATPAARQVLEAVAAGAPDALATREAQDALLRLGKSR